MLRPNLPCLQDTMICRGFRQLQLCLCDVGAFWVMAAARVCGQLAPQHRMHIYYLPQPTPNRNSAYTLELKRHKTNPTHITCATLNTSGHDVSSPMPRAATWPPGPPPTNTSSHGFWLLLQLLPQ